MQSILAIIFATAVAVSAVALPGSSGSGGTCAEGKQISCCVTDSSGSGALGNVASLNCALDQVSLLSLLDNQCPAGNTFCCPSNADGTLDINAECDPINL